MPAGESGQRKEQFMETLTYAELVARVSAPGAHLVGIDALTDARARKTGNPFGPIFKQSRGVAMVGASYQASVQRQGERDGAESAQSFVAESRPWGEWVIPNKIASHKGNFYLRTQSAPGQRKRSPWKVRAYRNEAGEFLSKESVAPFLPEKGQSEKQAAVGLERESQIEVREFAFSSIRRVRIGGRSYKLVP